MNLRIFTAQCSCVMSGMTTCSREPSGSWQSTKGWDKSSRRPEDLSMRSTSPATSAASSLMWVSSLWPPRAQNTWCGELIQISSTLGSSSSCCRAPKPATLS